MYLAKIHVLQVHSLHIVKEVAPQVHSLHIVYELVDSDLLATVLVKSLNEN